MSLIMNPVEQFFDLDGSPLDAGYIYLGAVNGNPETSPVQVYWDNAFTIPAAQPIRTVNGYPVRAGTPAPIFANQDVSIQVRNKKKLSVFYATNSNQSGTTSNSSIRTSNTLLVNSDNGKTILASGTFTQTFDACVALGAGWFVTYANIGSGIITFDPNLAENIDGFATERLFAGNMCIIYCDGTTLRTANINIDSQFFITGSLDNTKLARFEVDGNTAGTTRTITVPDYNLTLDNQKILSISASVAANALTVNFIGGTLDFRNPSLTSGIPNTLSVSANSIVVPSTATLGTTNASQARLVFLEAYNGGSPVLCVVNIAGGLQLDETNLISPTTISAGATSASVIYSASAVSANSPYRVVGFLDITEAVAGTWATPPSFIQGAGGLSANRISSVFGSFFESAQQTITAGGGLTLAHSLVRKPTLVQLFLVAQSAVDGYASGAEIPIGNNVITNGAVGRGAAIVSDATNINVRFGNDANTFILLNFTTGGIVSITNANYKLVVRAWA